MAELGRRGFDQIFTIARAVEKPVRAASGAYGVTPAHLPRFDHSDDGASLGLLIEVADRVVDADRVRVRASALADLAGMAVTVLHGVYNNGHILRRAWFSIDAVATVNACMAQAGHHAVLAVLKDYRPTLVTADGRAVLHRRQYWLTAGAVAVDGGTILAHSSGAISGI